MKNQTYTRAAPDGRSAKLMGIIVNMADYNVGADKGGAVTMFEDFDIDFNQEKYLDRDSCLWCSDPSEVCHRA